MSVAGREFLNLISAQEAASRGVNLSDKIRHAIYTAIQARSSEKKAEKGQLFRYPGKYEELAGLPENDFISALKYLLADRLVAQLCALEYMFETDKLEMRLFFLTKPDSAAETTGGIYREAIRYSAGEIQKWGNKRPEINTDVLYEYLKKDFENVPVDPESAPNFLHDPFAAIREDSFLYAPSPGQIAAFREDIHEALKDYRDYYEIPSYGVMILPDASVLKVYSAAQNFFSARVVPMFRNDPACARVFEQIYLEEEEAKQDKNFVPTADFDARRANAILKVLRLKGLKTGSGALTLQIISLIASRATEQMQLRYKNDVDTRARELLESLTGEDTKDEKLLRVFTEEEKAEIPDRLWALLKENENLVQGTWELSTGKVYGFIHKNPSAFKKWIGYLEHSPVAEPWQILLTKQLLENVEKDFPELFRDKEFVKVYGRMLRKAYMKYIPWYLWLFVFLGIQPFLDKAFGIAKNKIDLMQKKKAAKNEERQKKYEAELQSKRIEKATLLKQIQDKNEIKDALDDFYFVQHRIPTFAMLGEKFENIESAKLRKKLTDLGFAMIQDSSGKELNQVIVYPRDREWNRIRTRLYSVLEKIREVNASAESDSMQQVIEERVALVQKYLDTKASSLPKPASDPFEELEKLIQKEKHKEE